jgi:hypothetical protein
MDGQNGKDGNCIWTTATAPTSPNYTFTIANLSGPTGYTPKVGDIIIYSYYRYTITNVDTTTVKAGSRASIRGSAGAAATIAVGTVTTGEPGTNASVTNSGTSSAAVFDFVIPRGADGGGGSVLEGTYNTGTGAVTFTDGNPTKDDLDNSGGLLMTSESGYDVEFYYVDKAYNSGDSVWTYRYISIPNGVGIEITLTQAGAFTSATIFAPNVEPWQYSLAMCAHITNYGTPTLDNMSTKALLYQAPPMIYVHGTSYAGLYVYGSGMNPKTYYCVNPETNTKYKLVVTTDYMTSSVSVAFSTLS